MVIKKLIIYLAKVKIIYQLSNILLKNKWDYGFCR